LKVGCFSCSETVQINEDRVAELDRVKRTDYTIRFDASHLKLAPCITTSNERCTKVGIILEFHMIVLKGLSKEITN